MSEQADPKTTDLVLGGAVPSPTSAVLLGGIEGLRQRFAIASPNQKRELLPQALNYHEVGLDFLIDAVSDAELTVRTTACEILATVNSRKAKRAIARGIPLNSGDQVYVVYLSAMDYDDDCFTVLDSRQAYERYDFLYEGEHFHYIARYPFKEQAEQVAKELHQVILSNGDYQAFNQKYQLSFKSSNYYLADIAADLVSFYRNQNQPVIDWCSENGVDTHELFDDYWHSMMRGRDIDDWWDEQDAVALFRK